MQKPAPATIGNPPHLHIALSWRPRSICMVGGEKRPCNPLFTYKLFAGGFEKPALAKPEEGGFKLVQSVALPGCARLALEGKQLPVLFSEIAVSVLTDDSPTATFQVAPSADFHDSKTWRALLYFGLLKISQDLKTMGASHACSVGQYDLLRSAALRDFMRDLAGKIRDFLSHPSSAV